MDHPDRRSSGRHALVAFLFCAALTAALAATAAGTAHAVVVLAPSPIGTYSLDFSARPTGIAIRPDGTTYVVCGFPNRVDVFSRMGVKQFSFGSAGTGPGQFQ